MLLVFNQFFMTKLPQKYKTEVKEKKLKINCQFCIPLSGWPVNKLK